MRSCKIFIALTTTLALAASCEAIHTSTTLPIAVTNVFPLSVAASGRYLQTINGRPFLVFGENAAALFQNLPLTGPESATTYLSIRSSQGYNAIWATAVCSFYTSCVRNDGATYDGLTPFSGTLSSGRDYRGNSCAAAHTVPDCYDMTTTSGASSYWARMDAMLSISNTYNMAVFWNTVDTSACDIHSPGLWQMLTNNHAVSSAGLTNTRVFGTFLGHRYKTRPNIIWLQGDDYQCVGGGYGSPAADDAPIVDIIGGIAAAGDTHPQTLEAEYSKSTSRDWLDFAPTVNINGVYMYWPIYVETLHAYNQGTVPAFIVETNYEWDNNTQVEPNDASCSYPNRASSCVYEYLIRKQFYWAMTGGANAGYLTGAYPFSTAQPTFQSGFSRYLTSTGEANFVRWKSLFTANDLPWFALVPDQTGTLVTAGRGTPFSASGSCIANSHTCETQDAYVTVATASTPTDTWGVIYIPCYATNSTYGCAGTGGVTVAMSALGPAITAQWYDPTNGHHATIAGSPFTNRGTRTFTPAQTNSAGDPDWVLILHGGGRPRPHALSG